MDKSFFPAIEEICEEKGISKQKVLETIEMALAAAYKKDYGKKGQNIRVRLDPESGQIKIFQVKLAVDESMLKSEEEIKIEEAIRKKTGRDAEPSEAAAIPEEEKKIRFNPEKHIMLEEAKKLQPDIEPAGELWLELETQSDFGRIAAQTAKQVIIQRIREAERETVYEEYKNKEGEVVTGIVQRIERGVVFVDVGKTTGILFPEEQIMGEYYRPGQRLRALILEVQKDAKGPGIILSRSHAKMVDKLFELEVPEVAAGAVEIKLVAREAGSRTKIAVASLEEKVDPIGSCVGQKGTRVQAVISELGGEKIDIIEWSEDPAKFIANALAPAKVLNVGINKETREAAVIVPNDQLSLAIGKQGQNVRLAAKLTGWKIDLAGTKELVDESEATQEKLEKSEKEGESKQKETKSPKKNGMRKDEIDKKLGEEKAKVAEKDEPEKDKE